MYVESEFIKYSLNDCKANIVYIDWEVLKWYFVKYFGSNVSLHCYHRNSALIRILQWIWYIRAKRYKVILFYEKNVDFNILSTTVNVLHYNSKFLITDRIMEGDGVSRPCLGKR